MFRSLSRLSRGFCSSSRSTVSRLKNSEFKSGEESEENIVIGWIRRIRKMKTKSFLEVSDGSCGNTLQLIVSSDALPKAVSLGSCVRAVGLLRPNPRNADVEFAVKQMSVVGACDSADHPLGELSNIETERRWPHLRPHLSSFGALLRLRHLLEHNIRSAYHDLGYFGVHTPLMTRMDCEDGGETFRIHEGNRFFDVHPTDAGAEDVHLTVSSQLHLEAAVNGLGKVFTLSPAWRAEKSLTRHHLAEFYMGEAESVDAHCVESLCSEAETFMRHVAMAFRNSLLPQDLQILESKFNIKASAAMERIEAFSSSPFEKISFSEALQILLQHASEFSDVTPTPSTEDLSKEQEFFLTKHFGNRPIFVTNFPASSKPFYCAIAEDGTAEAVDLLLPMIGEVLGGSVRENDYQRLKQRMLSVSDDMVRSLEWYLDLRRFGIPPHGGYGFGFDRFLQFLIGVPNIRDIVPFPRHYKSCRL